MLKEEEIELAKKMLQAKADTEGYKTSKNLENIAKAKLRMFGLDNLFRCPCASKDSERFCISNKCKNDIENDLICHCRLFLKVKNER